MTRINCIPVEGLTDQHLIAEYRELPRVLTLAARWQAKPDTAVVDLPPEYRLGTGHVRFFYDKTKWLARRQAQVVAECRRRGFDIEHTRGLSPVPGLDGEWHPTDADMLRNLARLGAKVDSRRDFYRYWGIKVRTNPYTPMVEAILNRMDRS